MRIGPRHLGKVRLRPFSSFPPHLESEFHRRYNETSAPIASSGIAIGVFILMAFYFWDLVIDYAHANQTLMVRLGVGTWMITVISLPMRLRTKYFQILFASAIGLAGVGVVAIISLVENGLIVGLSGVMIVLMFNFGFLRLLFIPSLASGAVTCLAYNVAAAALGLAPLFWIANNFFLASALLAGASVTYLLERVCAIYHSACGREIRFGDIPAGEIFGEFAAIDGEPRTADVVAVTDALIASMPAEQFWEVLRQHQTVCAAILRRLTGITRSMLQRVVEFSTLPVRNRLHAELLRLAQVAGLQPGGTAAIIAPAPTHAEIASRISTHREAVTRELNDLARQKLIEKRGRDLVIRDIAMLASMVEDSFDAAY